MPAEQVFLPWDQCPLTQSVQWLVDRFADGPWLDMSSALVVLNSGHAQTRLQELLVEWSRQQDCVYTPPTFMTVGQLPEQLYQPQRPFASGIAQRLMWVRALQKMSREQLQSVIPNPPEPEEISRWMTIVQSLGSLHHDLASEMKRFFSGRDAAAATKDPYEVARWEFLVQAQSLYWDELNRAKLWDRQTARMIAVDHEECQTDKRIVVIGAVDLNQVVRAMLLQVQQQVTVLTFCGPSQQSLFDGLGCLDIDAWCDKHIHVPDDRIQVVQRPEDQAHAVMEYLGSLDGKYRADQITVGVPDDSVVPYLESEFAAYGVDCRYARGPALLKSAFFRLLEAIGNFGASREYVDLAAVIRHPEIARFLNRRLQRSDWLFVVDRWYESHLPGRLATADDLAGVSGRFELVRQVIAEVFQLLDPLLSVSQLPLNKWPQRWNQVLKTVLEDKEVHSQDPHDRSWIRSLGQCAAVLQAFEELDDQWVVDVHCADFLRLVFSELKNKYIAPAANPDSVSLLGWLDTPLDDAPVSVVTSFNEGLVPSSDPAHPFLTQTLRQKLQLLDNRRRYARDAYALELLIQSRQEYRLIVGRQNADGEPRTPSRLLMALSVDELPLRAKFLFQEPEETVSIDDSSDSPSQLCVPEPWSEQEPIDQFRVTDFKSYLACPYRYYLQRVLKLHSVSDSLEEMTGGQFGDLLHNVLQEFGVSEIKDSIDPMEIKLFLESNLEKQAYLLFGKNLSAGLRLQLTQAKLRLEQFSYQQAKHREAGWRIAYQELDASCPMEIDGQRVKIVGRIDRIDLHQDGNRWMVLDYKTSDRFFGVERMYFDRKEWVDLQLPLYHKLVQAMPESQGKLIQLGIVALPKKLEDIKFDVATWDETKLASAFRLAEEIIRQIRAGVFEPRKKEGYDEGIERICQTGVLNLDSASD